MLKNESFYSSPNFQLINFFENDPFVGHISTPITNSFLLNKYLSKLPVYNKKSSPLLTGISLGLIHGYFLLGPFFTFGPFRNFKNNLLISSLSTISLIFLLTLSLILYGKVTFKKKENKTDENLIINNKNWYQFSSGFLNGGFGGILLATLFLNYFLN